ncbi:MAG TPA: tetratricopeptide repeat protein [Chthoniobacterales bacterium]
MKSAVALAVASAIILILAFWIVWPRASEKGDHLVGFTHKSSPPSPVIDPPFGFHWGDSMANVEALLGYSSAEIVTRMATGENETWIVEGLVQPGLKIARFVFEKNALTGVELQCQLDAWTVDRYRTRVEELRTFFDNRYGEKQRESIGATTRDQRAGSNQFGYSWKLGGTSVAVISRSEAAPRGKRLSITDLTLRYRGRGTTFKPEAVDANAERWNDSIVSPVVRPKLQPAGDSVPAGSDLGITSAKLLNTSGSTETAFALQLGVKLAPDAEIDPTRTLVQVNFYDVLPTGEIVLTDAQVNHDWRSKRDWKQANPENLMVSYVRESPRSPENPQYFGYVATVYYDGRLECVRADPVPLVNLFPVRSFSSPFERAQAAAARGDYAAAASLYRRSADRGNLFALENLAWFYARGKGVEQDYHQAAVFYERAALQNTPRALNALAWFLATCPDDSIRNGTEAVRQATKACELTYWQEWAQIDTLAAAWAENGDFKRAVEYEQQARQLRGLDEQTRKKIDDRIALYLKRQPIRE